MWQAEGAQSTALEEQILPQLCGGEAVQIAFQLSLETTAAC